MASRRALQRLRTLSTDPGPRICPARNGVGVWLLASGPRGSGVPPRKPRGLSQRPRRPLRDPAFSPAGSLRTRSPSQRLYGPTLPRKSNATFSADFCLSSSAFRRFRPLGALFGPRIKKLRRMDPGRGRGTDFGPILVGSTRPEKVALLFQGSVQLARGLRRTPASEGYPYVLRLVAPNLWMFSVF